MKAYVGTENGYNLAVEIAGELVTIISDIPMKTVSIDTGFLLDTKSIAVTIQHFTTMKELENITYYCTLID